MAFFLIGRGPDDDLRLLSAKPHESRQAAMAELSRLSAEPSFDQWDAEVSVMDLDAGVPILLVRPAVAAPVIEAPTAETGDADAWVADLPVVIVEQPAAELLDETPLQPTEIAESVPDAIEAPFWEPPTVALIEPVGDVAIADAIVAEATEQEPASESATAPEIAPAIAEVELAAVIELEPAVVPEPQPEVVVAAAVAFQSEDAFTEPELVPFVEPEPAVAAEPQTAVAEVEPAPAQPAEENDELRAAILRTTEHMAAEGIVPPESIGPAAGLAESTPAVPAAPDVVDSPSAEVIELPETPLADIAVEQPALEEPRSSFWPWDKSGKSADKEAGVAPEVAGVYEALEEPAGELPEPDVEAVLRDSANVSSYDLATDEPVEDSTPLPQEPMSTLSTPDPGVEAAIPAAAESDFILDLDSVEPAPAEQVPADSAAVEPALLDAVIAEEPVSATEWVAADAPVSAVDATAGVSVNLDPAPPAVSPLEDYTCEDCVHTETCPNRDQRLPKDCGSFQWR